MSAPADTDTRQVAHSYFERLINQHDLPYVDELFDPAIAFYDPAIFRRASHRPGPGAKLLQDVLRDFS